MINFLKEMTLDFIYGKKFEVSAKKVKEWNDVENAMSGFPRDPIPSTIVTDIDCIYKIKTELPPYLLWSDYALIQKGIDNVKVPDVVLSFFYGGGSLNDISDYKSVLKYGMLYGKKRRLVMV